MPATVNKLGLTHNAMYNRNNFFIYVFCTLLNENSKFNFLFINSYNLQNLPNPKKGNPDGNITFFLYLKKNFIFLLNSNIWHLYHQNNTILSVFMWTFAFMKMILFSSIAMVLNLFNYDMIVFELSNQISRGASSGQLVGANP